MWFWKLEDAPLKGNMAVEIKIYHKWTEEDLKAFKTVHEKSWGFFMPPRNGDHIVVTGELYGKPVAMAYLNIRNFNIDYGVHVIRSCWRKKIGTRILTECFRIAKERDKKDYKLCKNSPFNQVDIFR
ncbi:MAG: GNAT family N-acetyltransferase [Thermotogae bacterium]|nr:GNAT family N-acetyltransferase [Thermotogota bacterium]